MTKRTKAAKGRALKPRPKSRRLTGVALKRLVRLLRGYEDCADYWLKKAKALPRATYSRREAVAYANAFGLMVDDIRELVPPRFRQPNAELRNLGTTEPSPPEKTS